MFNFEVKVPVSSYSITIEKFLSPEIKHNIYRKYKNLAHSPEGIWIETSAFNETRFALIEKDGSLHDFHISKELLKVCGITAEDVNIELKFLDRIKLKTPKLVLQKWRAEASENFVNKIALFNSVLSVEDDGKIVWSIRLSNLNDTSRILLELLKMAKGVDTFSNSLRNLLIKVKPISITPSLSTEFPVTEMSMPQKAIYLQKLAVSCTNGDN